MTNRLFLLLLAFIYLQPCGAKEQSLTFSHGVELVAEIENVGSRTWLVFLPGSPSVLFDPLDFSWARKVADTFHLNLLVVNKAGIFANGTFNYLTFQERSLRQNRIEDVLAAIHSVIPARDSIVLMGESEGGYIAPAVARANAQIQSLILLSSGTRSWIDEEIHLAAPVDRAEVEALLKGVVVGSRDLMQQYRGWTYAQLNSYDTSQTFEDLKALDLPVLVLHGREDRSIWLKGNLKDLQKLKRFKPQLQVQLIPNAGHGLMQTSPRGHDAEKEVCERLLSFMTESAIFY